MNSRVERKTVDLSPFPDLVVIYLGMRVNALTGVKTLFGFGPQIKNSVDQKPDGLPHEGQAGRSAAARSRRRGRALWRSEPAVAAKRGGSGAASKRSNCSLPSMSGSLKASTRSI
jgi:hypothetical protein